MQEPGRAVRRKTAKTIPIVREESPSPKSKTKRGKRDNQSNSVLKKVTEEWEQRARAENVSLEIESKGSCSRTGPYHANEDAYVLSLSLNEESNLHAFSVFDGHGGKAAAGYGKKHLHSRLSSNSKLKEDLPTAIEETYLQIDKEFCKWARETSNTSGSCAVTAVVHEDYIVAASAGDCCIMAGDYSGNFDMLVDRHQADTTEEFRRIRAANGPISMGRILGILQPSRGIGDIDVKDKVPKNVLISDPDLKIYRCVGPCYILLASDGVWDAMPRTFEIAKFVSDQLKKVNKRRDKARLVSKKLVEMCATVAKDDVTAILVCLKPKSSEPEI